MVDSGRVGSGPNISGSGSNISKSGWVIGLTVISVWARNCVRVPRSTLLRYIQVCKGVCACRLHVAHVPLIICILV